MISAIGAVIGIGIGLLLCLLQQEYGFVKLGDSLKLVYRRCISSERPLCRCGNHLCYRVGGRLAVSMVSCEIFE